MLGDIIAGGASSRAVLAKRRTVQGIGGIGMNMLIYRIMGDMIPLPRSLKDSVWSSPF
jgi:Trk-type K+ transport system membrane component